MQITNKAVRAYGRLSAILGPTNTGKTHYALERMLGYETGVIGFPLRLLARENYDRLVDKVGKNQVALITGEEKILPARARYYCCTVESMPIEQDFDFLAVDEIQLCADPERGHIFTDRLLRARGSEETLFLGSDTIAPILKGLVPEIEIESRPRLSTLTYTGFKKLTRLPKRSAVVAFSMDDVYAMADMIRRQRGGTAVVLGALSPRARNRQVEMYQSGEVDFMVATDAIGMGLNMDIHHVALAATRKFDGARPRPLSTAELAQIAGRAGRYTRDGTFGVTGRIYDLDPDVVEAIQSHKFEALEYVCWRNSALDYSSPKALQKSLERKSELPVLQRGRVSDDLNTLTELMARDDVMARADNPETVRLLWDVCQIPDFRKTLSESHQDIVAKIYQDLVEEARIDPDWMQDQIKRLDRMDGDVDTLMARIAHIRTWTYITHKSEWTDQAATMQEQTRALEDRLSDALHEALIRRFVDKRSAVLIQKLEAGETLLAGIKRDGEVVVEGERAGQLTGFRFIPDQSSGREEGKAVMAAARKALGPEIRKRIHMLLRSDDKHFTLSPEGQIFWQADASNPLPGEPVGRVVKGESILAPKVDVQDSTLFEGQDRAEITDKLQQWLEMTVKLALKPLFDLVEGDDLTAQAKGICFQLHEAMGVLPRDAVQDMITALDEEGRNALRKRKIRMGPLLIFLPELNKPAAVKLKAFLISLWESKEIPAEVPADGMVSFAAGDEKRDHDYYRRIGYPIYGPRVIRVDMLDRLVCAVYDAAQDGKFQAQHQMAEWLGSNIEDLYGVLSAMGNKRIVEDKVQKPEDTKDDEKSEDEQPVENKQEKPELDWFYLKRGSAISRPKVKKEKPKIKKDKKGKKGKAKPKTEKVYTAEAQQEDSPFAILQQLKK